MDTFISLEARCPLGNEGCRQPSLGTNPATIHDALPADHLQVMEEVTAQLKPAMNHS